MSRVRVAGRRRGWYDEAKAQTWDVGGRVLALTAASEWMVRDTDSDEAAPVTPDEARALLAAAGQSTTPVDQWSPPEPRRIGRLGRPAVGAKVEVRLPDDLLAAVDAIAAADGTSRADVIRAAVLDRVELRETGLDAWLRARAERSPFMPGGAANELEVWRSVQRLELAAVPLTIAELLLIADVLNGSFVATGFGSVTAHEAADATGADPGSYGAKWGVDEAALVDKLARLGPTADYALRQAVADFWDRPGADSGDPAMWAGLGFTVVP